LGHSLIYENTKKHRGSSRRIYHCVCFKHRDGFCFGKNWRLPSPERGRIIHYLDARFGISLPKPLCSFGRIRNGKALAAKFHEACPRAWDSGNNRRNSWRGRGMESLSSLVPDRSCRNRLPSHLARRKTEKVNFLNFETTNLNGSKIILIERL